jgi:D-amino-acid oxidase
MLLRTPVSGLPWWAAATGDAELVEAAAPYTAELRFTAPLVEMGPYLAGLCGRVRAAGGRFVRRRLAGVDEALSLAPVVVNAAGLAAGALCGDDAVYPARGDIVLVANPGLDVSWRDEGNPDGITYIHPRHHDVVLGGTFEPDRWDVTPDPAVREAILRRCVALVPALAGVPVLGSRVGLRPARHGGPRVEVEGRVVHAYGHGGAGMTLSWGCADEVTSLVQAVLRTS